MPALSSELRRQLESVVVQARDEAEAAARSALTKLAVDAAEPFDHFDTKQRDRRNRLRARGRQVGDVHYANASQTVEHLTQELAYEYWHRMLFARFLAENHLLMHPDGVPVSLDDCKELAPNEGAADEYVLAARYASRMLPQIFRTDDVLLEIELAPEQRLALERLLAGLRRETFLADDSLGWVYQFWQSKQKDEVNKSGEKIDGTTLPAVTQLFTEHYMVQFLLHNTIGAWWCGRNGIKGPAGGAGVPAGQAPVEMEYLRWKDDGTPAAGTFSGWPQTLAEFTALDPCCGSGHFLVSMFNLLVPLRMADERLSAGKASEAVIRQNLFGLELDPRCVQIAAFAVALAAWKFPDAGGYRELPALNIACSGQGVSGKRDQWLALANGDDRLRSGIEGLYDLFVKAPHLGSLIDPRREVGDMHTAGYADLQPLLTRALAKHVGDADLQAVGVAARGITAAADLLARRYTLVITNVPYLGRGKQADVVKQYLEEHYEEGKTDLATAFILRCLEMCQPCGSTALVTPQYWLFLANYVAVRQLLLKNRTWNVVARLGPRAFETISGEVVNVALTIVSNPQPSPASTLAGVDVTEAKTPADKSRHLAGLGNGGNASMLYVSQADQLHNPDSRVTITELSKMTRMGVYAKSTEGASTGDSDNYLRRFWELCLPDDRWAKFQGPPGPSGRVDGFSDLVLWEHGRGTMCRSAGARIRGHTAWSKPGILIGRMNRLTAGLYAGALFDKSCVVLTPENHQHLAAILQHCLSDEFEDEIRKLDQKMGVATSVFEKVPFDLAHWQKVAAEKYPDGLSPPHSTDPTQWLFKGDIATSTDPLQVAVVRLLGYRWPEQAAGAGTVDKFAVDDGIVCLPGARGDAPASERLRALLVAAYGEKWSESVLTSLLTDAGCNAGATLHDWLAGLFFDQHCKRFGQRPFIWHIWDGRPRDGFSVLLNYHRLTYKTLENLTYSYLADWITAQAADAKAEKVGAGLRLAAAQQLQEKLKLILAGEPPYDIFVRWKPLSEQSIGWNPDLNDGVRMNIRPFMEAGVLRKNPNVKWTKDRGNEPKRDKAEYPWFWYGDAPNTERVNDVHLTNAVKQAARDKLKAKGATP